MRSLNLYQLTRVNDVEAFTTFERILSSRQEKKITKSHEKDSLNALVTMLCENGINSEGLRHFYYSFEIPQIGKEFDLLRISNTKILNIELKSRDVGIEKIGKQLIQNFHYLSHLSREVCLFTFVSSNKKFYRFNASGIIEECNIITIINLIHNQTDCFSGDINSQFRVSDFLVSPLNTPQKFIRKEYFLTPQQQDIKGSIIQSIEKIHGCFQFFGMTGGPGTGKTLALYDLAHYYSAFGQVCVIHCGILSKGHEYLNRTLPSLDIYPAGSFFNIDFSKYKYVFVDESHRFHQQQFDALVDIVQNNGLICVFSYDKRQVLSHKETNRNVEEKIKALPGCQEYKLSDRIRTNKEMSSFIRRLLYLHHTDVQSSYPSISVIYANNNKEATFFIEEYRRQGFVFIKYTASMFHDSPFDKYSGDTDTHHVIGQEFDNILMLIDDTFRYNDKGVLIAKIHPNPDYLYRQLLFQGLTRVREKLAIIVLENQDMFSNILSILDNPNKII